MASDRDRRLDALLDRQDILDCLTRMSRGTDRFDRELFLSCFHPDAVIATGPFVGSAEELFDWSRGLQEMAHSGTYHVLLNHSCELEGDEAHAETYYLYIANNRDATNVIAGGRYLDRFQRREGEWKLLTRNNMIEWTSLVPAAEIPVDVSEAALNGLSARSREDASYLRPLVNKRARHVPALPGAGS